MTTGPTDPPQDQPPRAQEEPPTEEPPKEEPPPDPTAGMTVEQQADYWRDQSEKWRGLSQKHEDRERAYYQAAGEQSPDQVREAIEAAEKARQERLTEQERAVEEARKQARGDTIAEYGPRLARTAFELALGDMPEDQRDALIDDLNLSKFVAEDGSVDADMVKAAVARIAPTDMGRGSQREDYGGGRRETTKTSGIDAGREIFERERDRHVPAVDTSS